MKKRFKIPEDKFQEAFSIAQQMRGRCNAKPVGKHKEDSITLNRFEVKHVDSCWIVRLNFVPQCAYDVAYNPEKNSVIAYRVYESIDFNPLISQLRKLAKPQ